MQAARLDAESPRIKVRKQMQTVLVAKGEENRITRLCGREGR